MATAEELTTDRPKTHGDYGDVSRVTVAAQEAFRLGPRWGDLPEYMKLSIQEFAHKVARIVCGDPFHRDHWDDLAGYTKTVTDRLPSAPKKNPEPELAAAWIPDSPLGHATLVLHVTFKNGRSLKMSLPDLSGVVHPLVDALERDCIDAGGTVKHLRLTYPNNQLKTIREVGTCAE